ncbi:hypothetical protein GRF29_161g1148181 [Pseudopithomyces chartarum]|uniref:Uncharacterized protein n=1 Tax=Pseudopithomyces chartarum TaxID=1892770 RepID=A0AAN6RDD2_9PLEO|nr:hypothetical protein GRF29_161g1148181 [Pseudopithomyces chartarum]
MDSLPETTPPHPQSEKPPPPSRTLTPSDKIELTDTDAWHLLGYSFPTWRKWQILGVVFLIQISMNMNASLYANGVSRIAEEHGISKQVARIPQMAFLVAYGFGCELWAPWSEEYGRWPIQQLSLFLVNVWQIPCALSKNFATEAKRRRKTGEDPNIYGPNEIRGRKITPKEFATIFGRPFYMFFTEPIVLWLSLLSGFSDALIFTFLQSFQPVYEQWGFGTIGISLAFIPLLIGYILSYLSYLPSIHHFRGQRRKGIPLKPEVRLWWLLFLAPLETIGLFGFAWTSLGPSHGIPWIAPMIFSTLIAIANYAIYQSSIDYQTAAYGPYAASATGGNDLARDFLAGIAALYSAPMYENIPGRPLEYARAGDSGEE